MMCTKHHFNSISYFISVAKISVIIILAIVDDQSAWAVSCGISELYSATPIPHENDVTSITMETILPEYRQ